ncbi:MAG: hypothetical protein A2420_00785 [Candidatus Moranbacteria bacterium RIFOXYC1_FULL_44_13]|nr:MAG: hypothetical protein A2420_00785 [Candidatus Moranbacteria bacterium RIFOXYC1_FULL_44_13]OGI37100.1 MAG: hypothetical protein A2612_04705 [Candidatus Moranbacteria bacterium RIFOXYD1_FULL_44_12]
MYSLFQPCNHTIDAALPSYGIVELGTTGQHRFDEFFGWSVADRFGYGMKRNSVINQYFPDIKMILGISGKPIHFCNDENIHAAFVFPAVLDSPKEFLAIG